MYKKLEDTGKDETKDDTKIIIIQRVNYRNENNKTFRYTITTTTKQKMILYLLGDLEVEKSIQYCVIMAQIIHNQLIKINNLINEFSPYFIDGLI